MRSRREELSRSVHEEKSGLNSEEGVDASVEAESVESVEAKRRVEEERMAWEERMPAAPILLPDRNPTGDTREKHLTLLLMFVPNCLVLAMGALGPDVKVGVVCRGIERTLALGRICASLSDMIE